MITTIILTLLFILIPICAAIVWLKFYATPEEKFLLLFLGHNKYKSIDELKKDWFIRGVEASSKVSKTLTGIQFEVEKKCGEISVIPVFPKKLRADNEKEK